MSQVCIEAATRQHDRKVRNLKYADLLRAVASIRFLFNSLDGRTGGFLFGAIL